MDYAQLEQALLASDTRLQLERGDLGGAFDALLERCYQLEGRVLQIDVEERENADGAGPLTVRGKASFLRMPELPIEAGFSLDEAGAPHLFLRYTLIAEAHSSARWSFSNSFPDLPLDVPARGAPRQATRTPFLDQVRFRRAELVVTDRAGTDPLREVELEAGLNFVGLMWAQGPLGLLANLLSPESELSIHGPIRVPLPTEVIIPRLSRDVGELALHPWEVADFPGIHLEAAFDLEAQVRGARLGNARFRHYCPLDSGWLQLHELYQPTSAVSCTLEVPSADVSLDLLTVLETGASSLYVEGNFTGVSLGNLAQLGDLSGSTDLVSQLPEPLVDATRALERLELSALSLSLSWSNGLRVDSLGLLVRLPGLDWEVWDDHLVVSELGTTFVLNSPFSSPSLDVTLWGKAEVEGVALGVEAARVGGAFLVRTRLEETCQLPLKQLMKRCLPGVSPPADLTVDQFDAEVMLGSYFSIAGSLASAPETWTLDIGPTPMEVSDVDFDLTLTRGQPARGAFRGTLGFSDDLRLNLRYQIPGEFVIRAIFPQVQLRGLLRRLSGKSLKLPKGFDLELRNSEVLIQGKPQSLVFQLATSVDGFGLLACEARRLSGGGWGAAVGISLDDVRLASLPGLKGLKAIESCVDLKDLLLVLSTYESADFRFPDLGAFSNPAVSSTPMTLPASATGVIAGLNVHAKWVIDTERKELKLLQGLLGLSPTLDATLQIGSKPTADARLYVGMTTKLDGKWPLSCKVGVALAKGKPLFFLIGSLDITVGGKRFLVDCAMRFSPTGAFLSGTMKGTVKLGGLKLSNLSLQVGINPAGLPSLGIAGNLAYKQFNSSIALFFDSTDPSRSVLAGAVSELSLYDVATTLTGLKKLPKGMPKLLKGIQVEGTQTFVLPASLGKQLDKGELEPVAAAFASTAGITIPSDATRALLVVSKQGKAWFLTDLAQELRHYQLVKTRKGIEVSVQAQLYVAPNHSQIGTLEYPQGFFLNGAIRVHGLVSTTTVQISPSRGCSADSHLNKALTIYKQAFFHLAAAKGKGGPRLSFSTFRQPRHEVEAFRDPHLFLSGRLTLLGLTVEAFVSLTSSGFRFEITHSLKAKIAKVSYGITGSVDSSFKLEVGGSVSLAFQTKLDLGALGKLKFKVKVSGELEAGFDGKKAYARFAASFKQGGQTHRISVRLRVTGSDLKNIASCVAKEIEKTLKSWYREAERWASGIEDGAIEGVKDLGQVLKKELKVDAAQAARTLGRLGRSSNQIASSLKKDFAQSANGAAKALDAAGVDVHGIGKALKGTFKLKGDKTAAALKTLKKNPKQVAAVLKTDYGMKAGKAGAILKSSFGLSKGDLSKALKGVGFSSKDVDKYVGSAYASVKKEAGKAAKSAEKKGKQAVKGAKRLVGKGKGKRKRKRK